MESEDDVYEDDELLSEDDELRSGDEMPRFDGEGGSGSEQDTQMVAADDDFEAANREYEELQKEEEGMLQILKGRNKVDVQTGRAVNNQKKLWEKALEIRMGLQKLVSGANSVPKIKNPEGDALRPSLLQTLETLMDLEDAMVNRIGSIAQEESEGPKTQLTSTEDAWERLDHSYSRFAEYRNNSLDKWYRKSQISTGAAASRGNLKAFNQSISQQVANAMKDPSRLVARMLSKPPSQSAAALEENKEEEVKSDCFDDTEFYQQLLREFIESSDPSTLGEMNTEVMRTVRNKKRKAVDRRASKGRKIRYIVHDPLVNFMAPQPMSLPPMTSQLFSSLFGTHVTV